MTRFKLWMGVAAFVAASSATIVHADQTPSSVTFTGPSSSQSPYLVPLASGVQTVSILTTGDTVANTMGSKPSGTPYRMVGTPDGLGVFNNNGNTFTVLMNHELTANEGVVRAHGGTGSFVSRLVIRKKDLSVVQAGDLIQSVSLWNTTTQAYDAPAKGVVFTRFCSADLPLKYALYNPITRNGTQDRLFMNGEEYGEGRAFAHDENGVSYQLPRLGKYAHENVLAHPYTFDKTVLISNDDSSSGQIYVYVGTKTRTGSPSDRAGLTNGQLYGVKVAGYAAEDSATGIPDGTRFSLQPLGDVSALTGAQLETTSNGLGITRFLRPEDGAWNVNNWNQYFFNTTNAFNKPSRTWRLSFNDAFNPEQGGTIDMVLDGSEGQQMLDNLCVDYNNRILLQEDVGNNPYLGKVRMLDLNSGDYTVLAQHDPARFLPGAPNFITQDEESSGIIDASDVLGNGWYLLDVQAHLKSADPELVEGGQLLAMYVPAPKGGSTNPYPRGSIYR
jgi:hypothetical protein